MAKTYLDQLVEYPAKVIQKIGEDKYCVGLLLDKKFDAVTEDDFDDALDNNIFDYQYVDNTVDTASAYIWVEIEIPSVSNKHIKGVKLYVTVSCHKGYMKLDHGKFKGIIGNRRDNLVRYIDRLINDKLFVGIGKLELNSVKTLSAYNNFVFREMCYEVPDFNVVDELEETGS